jgi:hypothetical protein
VRLDRCLGDAELVGDLLVQQARRQHRQHPELLGRQAREPRCDIGLGALERRRFRVHRSGYPDVTVQYGLQGLDHLLDGGGFRHEAGGAVRDRTADHGGIFVGRDDHDRQRGMMGAHLHQRTEAIRARHVQVEQQQVGLRVAFGFVEQRGDRIRFNHRRVRHGSSERVPESLAEQRMVVCDDDFPGHQSPLFIR